MPSGLCCGANTGQTASQGASSQCWQSMGKNLTPGSPGALLRGRLEATGRQAQINTFGGGVNEVQREIVAAAGLGMTRGSR